MSISSSNLIFSTFHFSSRQFASTHKRNGVPPWRQVPYPTLFLSPPNRGKTIAQSILSHDANNGNISSRKSPEWKEEQENENPKQCNHETAEEHKKESIEAESIEEHKQCKWALQPDLTVKRRVHFDGRPLAQFKLEKEKLDVPEQCHYYYYNTLHDAIIEGNLNVILDFLESSLEAAHTKITERKETVLHIAIAVQKKNPTFIDKLLKYIPREALFSVNNEGETLLHYAAAHGNLEAAQLLVQQYPELPNLVDNNLQYPIHHAIKNGHSELVSYLMDMTRGLSRHEYGSKTVLPNYLIQSNLCDEAVKLFNLQYEDKNL